MSGPWRTSTQAQRLNHTQNRAFCMRSHVILSTSGRVCYHPILQRGKLRLGELSNLPKAIEPSRDAPEGSVAHPHCPSPRVSHPAACCLPCSTWPHAHSLALSRGHAHLPLQQVKFLESRDAGDTGSPLPSAPGAR